jgi:hypothetical protein
MSIFFVAWIPVQYLGFPKGYADSLFFRATKIPQKSDRLSKGFSATKVFDVF